MKKKVYKMLYFLSVFVLIISICFASYELFIAEYLSNKTISEVMETVQEIPEDKQEEFIKKYKEMYPDVNFPDGLLAMYYPIYATNQDFRGWLSIPEFNVNLPIVQGKDNDYYLKKDINKKYSGWGTPFMDYHNNINPMDRNLILYGHNSRYRSSQDKMFAPLNKYQTIEGFKQAPVITFNTLYEECQWKVYAAFITNTKPQDDNGYVFPYLISECSAETFGEYLYEINERKLYHTGVDILPTDTILTFSTCNYTFKDARFVIICRKVRPGESTDVDFSSIQINSSPRYPQAYYDAKKIQNPYADAYNWNP